MFAYDKGLCQYIQNNLKANDRILLNGKLGHLARTGDDGKKIHTGFIIVDKLHQIARRSQSQSESTDETAIAAMK